jgi:thioredoxin reductase (NADPH)
MAHIKHLDLIIIGSGPAGLTAGIYASRARLNPLIIQGKLPGGQLMGTTYVNNWPGEINILGPELMMKIQNHAAQTGCELLPETVVQTDLSKRPFTVTTHRGKDFTADALIIATGSVPKKLNCPGEDEYWGKGVTSCAVCDSALYQDKNVIIIGGGDSAMEYVFALAKYTDKITVVHILDKLTAAPNLQQRIKDFPTVKIIYSSTITEIHGENGHVAGVTLKNQLTNQLSKIPTDGVFLAIGLSPNSAIVKEQLELNNQGYITVTNMTHTSIPGVFAAGDVIDPRYRQAISSAGSGCMAALDAERYLCQLAMERQR